MAIAHVVFRVDLTPTQAAALAQLCKRITFPELEANAVDRAEADAMRDAVDRLRRSLAEVGYPR